MFLKIIFVGKDVMKAMPLREFYEDILAKKRDEFGLNNVVEAHKAMFGEDKDYKIFQTTKEYLEWREERLQTCDFDRTEMTPMLDALIDIFINDSTDKLIDLITCDWE